jgi:hypothetical protein
MNPKTPIETESNLKINLKLSREQLIKYSYSSAAVISVSPEVMYSTMVSWMNANCFYIKSK